MGAVAAFACDKRTLAGESSAVAHGNPDNHAVLHLGFAVPRLALGHRLREIPSWPLFLLVSLRTLAATAVEQESSLIVFGR